MKSDFPVFWISPSWLDLFLIGNVTIMVFLTFMSIAIIVMKEAESQFYVRLSRATDAACCYMLPFWTVVFNIGLLFLSETGLQTIVNLCAASQALPGTWPPGHRECAFAPPLQSLSHQSADRDALRSSLAALSLAIVSTLVVIPIRFKMSALDGKLDTSKANKALRTKTRPRGPSLDIKSRLQKRDHSSNINTAHVPDMVDGAPASAVVLDSFNGAIASRGLMTAAAISRATV